MSLPQFANLRGPIARGTLRTTLVLGLRLIVQAGTLLLVARMLGPDQFGAFAGVAALAVMLGTLATFGTHLVLLGEVSKDPRRREQVLAYALPFTILCGSGLLVIYLLICTLALQEAHIPVTALLAIGATETLLQPLFGLPAVEHLALGRVARSQLLTTLPLALRLMAAISVFLMAPADPLTLYGYGYFVASLIAICVATATMPAPWPRWRAWRLPTLLEVKEAAGYAAINITATSPVELDKTLATKLLPLAASGLYAASARVIGAATLPISAMMLSALPRLFRDGQDNPKRVARLLHWIFVITFIYGVALAAALWFIAPAFGWIFGTRYHGIEHTVRWLCLAVPGMALRMSAGNVLMALGKPWMRVAFEVGGLIVLVVAAATLAPRLPSQGMPIALAISEWSMALVGMAMIVRVHTAPSRSQP